MRQPALLAVLSVAFLLARSPAVAAVEVPCEFVGGLLWVKIDSSSEREKLTFLVDTGAGVSVLDLGTARRRHISLGSPTSVRGVLGTGVAYSVGKFAGELAGVPVPEHLLALDLGPVSRACGRRIDGLLGLDFLRQHVVQIDYIARKIRIFERDEIVAPPGEKLRLAARNDALCARVVVNGVNAVMRIDTGCDSPLQWVVKARAGQRLGGPSIGVISGSMTSATTDVQLGSAHFSAVKTGLHRRQLFPGEDGLIGNGLLSEFLVTIDAARQTLHLARR